MKQREYFISLGLIKVRSVVCELICERDKQTEADLHRLVKHLKYPFNHLMLLAAPLSHSTGCYKASHPSL